MYSINLEDLIVDISIQLLTLSYPPIDGKDNGRRTITLPCYFFEVKLVFVD